MPAILRTADLPPELLKQLGITLPRRHSFTKQHVRSHALRVLSTIAGLSQHERRRVLEHALKVNQL